MFAKLHSGVNCGPAVRSELGLTATQRRKANDLIPEIQHDIWKLEADAIADAIAMGIFKKQA